ncbi:MAG TPA: energy transducer TonB [Thermoanaerobaculia bacterium]|nr:energy transducer TonB [Thermoanaerobaculia bacterium]
MFESSLIALEEKQHPRRRWAPLPVAIGLHLVALVIVGLAQVWNVEAVGDPQTVTPFSGVIEVMLPPPAPPPAGGPQPQHPTTTPTPPQTPVQPDTRVLPDTPADPEPQTAGASSEGSLFGSQHGVQGGIPGGVDGGDPNSRNLGGIGWDGPVAPPEPQNEIIRFNGSMTRPVQISGRQPRYTELARRAGTQGVVILEAVIDKQGHVRDVRILKRLNMGLDEEAVAAVKEWTFEPARMGGRPVSVYYTLTVNFQIQR